MCESGISRTNGIETPEDVIRVTQVIGEILQRQIEMSEPEAPQAHVNAPAGMYERYKYPEEWVGKVSIGNTAV
jgi:hypothetical protein